MYLLTHTAAFVLGGIIGALIICVLVAAGRNE